MKPNSEVGVGVGVNSFSILKRIVMGETRDELVSIVDTQCAFSILKRIVMGETIQDTTRLTTKRIYFQYPQADRDG